MRAKGDFRLHVSQYKTLQLPVHTVGFAFRFVLQFSCSVDLFIPLFVMYFHICSNRYVVYTVGMWYTLKIE